jgi:hypothetical protein
METAIVCDIYCKWTNTNAFCWTLHNIVTYLKQILNFWCYLSNPMFLLNTQNMQETNVCLNNSYIIIEFSIKPSQDPMSESPRPWLGSRPEVGNHCHIPSRSACWSKSPCPVHCRTLKLCEWNANSYHSLIKERSTVIPTHTIKGCRWRWEV